MADPVTIVEVYPSARRRRLIVGCCTLLVAALLLWNLPVPGLRRTVRAELGGPYVLLQLDQGWALFAPDASQSSVFVHLEVVRLDGRVDRIDFPSGEPWIGTYRAYRWSSYEEALIESADLQRDAFAYAIREAGSVETIDRVDIVLLESDVSAGTHGPFEPVYERSVIASVTP